MGLYELESPLAKLGDWRDVDYTLIGDVNDLRAAVVIQIAAKHRDKISWTVDSPRTPSYADDDTPLDTTPTLKDKKMHTPVYGGRTIGRYITTFENTYVGSPLRPGPDELQKWLNDVARYENACYLEEHEFDPRASALLAQAKAKAAGSGHDADLYRKLQEELKAVLKKYMLPLGWGYLGGQSPSLGDVMHIPMIRALDEFPDAVPALKEEDFEHVARWWKQMADYDVKTADFGK